MFFFPVETAIFSCWAAVVLGVVVVYGSSTNYIGDALVDVDIMFVDAPWSQAADDFRTRWRSGKLIAPFFCVLFFMP